MKLAITLLLVGVTAASAEPVVLPPEHGAACSFETNDGVHTKGSETRKLGRGWIGQLLFAYDDTLTFSEGLRAFNCADGRQFVISAPGERSDGFGFDQPNRSPVWSFVLSQSPLHSETIVETLTRAAVNGRYDVRADDYWSSAPYPEWKRCGCDLLYPDLAEASQ